MAKTHIYSYKPLKFDDSIRILEVQGSRDAISKPICRLVEARLSDSPQYYAISSTWEGQTPRREIELDGKPHLVTENCEAALRYFRPDSEEAGRRLWIDSVCIDQSEDAMHERGHQIGIMGQIYAEATSVQAWLCHSQGLNRPQDRSVVHWLREIAEAAISPRADQRRQRVVDLADAADFAGLFV